MGLLELLGAPTENCKMKNCYPQWDSNPGPFAYEATLLSIALLVEISTEHLNVDRVLPECDIKIYLCMSFEKKEEGERFKMKNVSSWDQSSDTSLWNLAP